MNMLATKGHFKPSYGHWCATEPLIPLTIGQLLDCAVEKYGDREAAVFPHENVRLSYREVKEKADEIAAAFLAVGLKPGDTLAISGHSCSIAYLTCMAARRAGLILACTDANDGITFWKLFLRKIKPKAVVIIELNGEDITYDALISQAPELSKCKKGNLHSKHFPNLRIVITASTVLYPGSFDWNEIPKMAAKDGIQDVINLQNTIQPDEATTILFTSGTTGEPKAVLLSHHMIVNLSFLKAKEINIAPVRNLLALCQFGHIGDTRLKILGLRKGITIIFGITTLNIKSVIETLEQERCSMLYAAAPPLIDILNYVEENDINLHYPEVISISATPVTDKLMTDIKKLLPAKIVQIGYGLTESSGLVFSKIHVRDSPEVHLLTAYVEAKVVDSEGKMVPMGTPGELWIRGCNVMMGYFGDDDVTAKTITTDKWLKTGDKFIIKEDGSWTFVGRISQTIKRAGLDIDAPEIENILHSHPAILDVHVFGIQDEIYGEEICAFIKIKGSQLLKKEDVIKYCKGKLADFQTPRYIRFVEKFPINEGAKVIKKDLLKLIDKDKDRV